MSAVGEPVARKEDQRLITGHGAYVSDLQLPRTRHVAFLRSTHAHARIGSVEVARARAMAGVRAVFTGQDFAAVELRAQSALPAYVETAQPVLAVTKTRFAGEPVAAVVADDRYLAEDALALIDVDYEPLPVTVSAWAGPTAGGAPRAPVHDEAPDNICGQHPSNRSPVFEKLGDVACEELSDVLARQIRPSIECPVNPHAS